MGNIREEAKFEENLKAEGTIAPTVAVSDSARKTVELSLPTLVNSAIGRYFLSEFLPQGSEHKDALAAEGADPASLLSGPCRGALEGAMKALGSDSEACAQLAKYTDFAVAPVKSSSVVEFRVLGKGAFGEANAATLHNLSPYHQNDSSTDRDSVPILTGTGPRNCAERDWQTTCVQKNEPQEG